MIIQFTLNGEKTEIDCEPERRLQSLLRDLLNLKSVQYNCRGGHCGVCSIFMNDRIVSSCLIPAFRVRGARIETMEGFSQTAAYEEIEKAFREEGVFLCSNCAPARVLTIEELLRLEDLPEGDSIDKTLSMVRCRCSSYTPLRRAIRNASYKRQTRLRSSNNAR